MLKKGKLLTGNSKVHEPKSKLPFVCKPSEEYSKYKSVTDGWIIYGRMTDLMRDKIGGLIDHSMLKVYIVYGGCTQC